MGTEMTAEQLGAAEEIRRAIYEYGYHLDMNHPDDLADLFVEDCVVVYGPDFGAEGREEYRKTLEGIDSFFEATSHHVSNTVIDFLSDEEATARSALYAFHRYRRDRPDSHVWGQYHDVFVKKDGAWKFKRRELRSTASSNYHVKEEIPIGRNE